MATCISNEKMNSVMKIFKRNILQPIDLATNKLLPINLLVLILEHVMVRYDDGTFPETSNSILDPLIFVWQVLEYRFYGKTYQFRTMRKGGMEEGNYQ